MVEGFEIIDAHCHPIAVSGDCIKNGYGSPMTAEEFMSEEKSFGIDMCCGSVLKGEAEPKSFAVFARFNEQALEVQKKYAGFYYPGFQVHPRFIKESIDALEKLHKAGWNWVGELVPYMHGYREYATPELFEILAVARDLGMAVNMHTMGDEDVDKLMTELPGLTAVMAHPGDGNLVRSRSELMKKHKNLYWDICGTGLFRWGMLRYMVEQCGAEKLLFGTDFPICSIPMQIYGVLGERISDEAKKAIFSGNFRRLAKL